MSEIIIRGGTIVTVDPEWRVLAGDVACRDGELVCVGDTYTPVTADYEVIDAEGCVVMPGIPMIVRSHWWSSPMTASAPGRPVTMSWTYSK